jgi:hypothetical protein
VNLKGAYQCFQRELILKLNMDLDKKIKKLQKEKESTYQGEENPAFKSEGAEFGAHQKSVKPDNNNTKEEVDFDKMKGRK